MTYSTPFSYCSVCRCSDSRTAFAICSARFSIAAKAWAPSGLPETDPGRGIFLPPAGRGAIFAFGAGAALASVGLGALFATAGALTAAAFFLAVFFAATVLIFSPFFLLVAATAGVFLAAFAPADFIVFFGVFVALRALVAFDADLAAFACAAPAPRAFLEEVEGLRGALPFVFAAVDEPAFFRVAVFVRVAELARFGFATVPFTAFLLRTILILPGLL